MKLGGKPLLAHVDHRRHERRLLRRMSSPSSGTRPTASALAVAHTGVNFVLQAEQRGTGHALMVAREALLHR